MKSQWMLMLSILSLSLLTACSGGSGNGRSEGSITFIDEGNPKGDSRPVNTLSEKDKEFYLFDWCDENRTIYTFGKEGALRIKPQKTKIEFVKWGLSGKTIVMYVDGRQDKYSVTRFSKTLILTNQKDSSTLGLEKCGFRESFKWTKWQEAQENPQGWKDGRLVSKDRSNYSFPGAFIEIDQNLKIPLNDFEESIPALYVGYQNGELMSQRDTLNMQFQYEKTDYSRPYTCVFKFIRTQGPIKESFPLPENIFLNKDSQLDIQKGQLYGGYDSANVVKLTMMPNAFGIESIELYMPTVTRGPVMDSTYVIEALEGCLPDKASLKSE